MMKIIAAFFALVVISTASANINKNCAFEDVDSFAGYKIDYRRSGRWFVYVEFNRFKNNCNQIPEIIESANQRCNARFKDRDEDANKACKIGVIERMEEIRKKRCRVNERACVLIGRIIGRVVASRLCEDEMEDMEPYHPRPRCYQIAFDECKKVASKRANNRVKRGVCSYRPDNTLFDMDTVSEECEDGTLEMLQMD